MALDQDFADFKFEVEKIISDLKARIAALEAKAGN